MGKKVLNFQTSSTKPKENDTGKERLFYKPILSNVMKQSNDDVLSTDKNNTQMSNFRHSDRTQKLIQELNTMHGDTKKKILELIESLKNDKRKPHEIKKILLTEVKFMSRASIYNAMPDEFKRDYTTKPKPSVPIETEYDRKKFDEQMKDFKTPDPIDTSDMKSDLIDSIDDDVPTTTIDKPIYKTIEGKLPPVEQTPEDFEAQYRAESGNINSLDTEPPFRLAILDPEKSTAEFMRQISKLKGRGWKIIEVQVRYIS